MRALKSEFGGIDLVKRRAELRTRGRFILRADISRFYGTIYTHSIPWALDGKIIAKRVRRGGFGNDLDASINKLQDGQTLGIPTGPDASLIIGEVIASAVDYKLEQAGIRIGMRYIDDYELVFPSRSAAEAGLAKLEAAAWDFELALNLRKTSIDELPVELDRRWNAELRNYYFRTNEPLNTTDGPLPNRGASSEELIDYFNKAFLLKSQNTHDPVLAYAVARLRELTVQDPDLLLDLICQCALSEHGALNALVAHYEKGYDKGNDKHNAALDQIINSILEQDSMLAMGSEIAWALWAAICFDRRISAKLAKRLDGNPDSVVAILALHARSLGIIRKTVRFPIWESRMRGSSLSGPEWLLAYEADIKGWLPSAEKPNHVDSNPGFSLLKQANVSFYDADSNPRSLVSAVQVPGPTIFS
jgi:hypothetical protein